MSFVANFNTLQTYVYEKISIPIGCRLNYNLTTYCPTQSIMDAVSCHFTGWENDRV